MSRIWLARVVALGNEHLTLLALSKVGNHSYLPLPFSGLAFSLVSNISYTVTRYIFATIFPSHALGIFGIVSFTTFPFLLYSLLSFFQLSAFRQFEVGRTEWTRCSTSAR